MLREGAYPYDRDSVKYYCQRKNIYINFTMEDVTGYKYAREVWTDFEIKIPHKCHDLYMQSNTLLLALKVLRYINLILRIFSQYQDLDGTLV